MTRRSCGIGAALCLLCWAAPPLAAQQLVVPAGELDRYLRFLDLSGKTVAGTPLVFRSPSTLRALGPLTRDDNHPWSGHYHLSDSLPPARLSVFLPDVELVYNSDNPHGGNDGALWAGKGLSGALTGGAEARLGAFTLTLAPTLWFAQNSDFATQPVTTKDRSVYAYPFFLLPEQIDWPQRFGPSAVTALDWGQSGVRFKVGAFTAGVSTENVWWGPAHLNPIVMSSTAAGFPHADVGTSRPVDIGIGHGEIRLIYGRLTESDYFDTVSVNNARFLTGVTLGYAPSFLPGFTFGITRVFYKLWNDTITVSDVVTPFQSVFKLSFGSLTDAITNDDRDQILSIVARWTLPESGAEAYVEWARNDHNLNLRDFLLEPDHSRAYTVGFAKRLGSDGATRLLAEYTELALDGTSRVRADPTYYTHHIALQGYTQLGQLIGAEIGPGGESEAFGVDRYQSNGRIGVVVQRVVHNDDAYYRLFAPTEKRSGHDIEVSFGLSAYRFVGDLAIGTALTIGRELNRYYIVGNDVTNVNLKLSLQPLGH